VHALRRRRRGGVAAVLAVLLCLLLAHAASAASPTAVGPVYDAEGRLVAHGTTTCLIL
jgi:acyl-coenzyme A thioesterase PaaI-like protein